jgi:hypothetical protein
MQAKAWNIFRDKPLLGLIEPARSIIVHQEEPVAEPSATGFFVAAIGPARRARLSRDGIALEEP